MTLLKRGDAVDRAKVRRQAAVYLQSFENWLHDRKGVARSLRSATFGDLVKGKVPTTVEEELAMAPRCPDCRGPILHRSKRVTPGSAYADYCSQCAKERASADNTERHRK